VQTVEFIAAVIAVVGLIGYLVAIGLVERKPQGVEEDAARAYFDAHGRWPDED
jgi:hypothetical protein